MSGVKWFVTFIDCYTRMTWVYMLKHKNQVFQCFYDFHKLIANQFNAKVRIIRTDNGTEYVNNEFKTYVSDMELSVKPLVRELQLRMVWPRGRIVTY